MDLISKETSKMDCGTVKEAGKEVSAWVIDMMASTGMIKNGDSEHLPGVLAMYIKEITRQTYETASARCIG